MAAHKTITDKELEILFGGEVGEVEILNKTYKFYPFNVKQTSIVMKKIGVLIPILGNYVDTNGNLNLPETTLVGIITDSFDSIVEVVAMILKRDVEWVECLDMDTLIKVLIEIIRVNKSFFEKRVKGTVEATKAMFPQLTVMEHSEN